MYPRAPKDDTFFKLLLRLPMPILVHGVARISNRLLPRQCSTKTRGRAESLANIVCDIIVTFCHFCQICRYSKGECCRDDLVAFQSVQLTVYQRCR